MQRNICAITCPVISSRDVPPTFHSSEDVLVLTTLSFWQNVHMLQAVRRNLSASENPRFSIQRSPGDRRDVKLKSVSTVGCSNPTAQPNSGHPYPLYMFGVVIYPAWDLSAVYFQCLWSKSTLQQFAVDFQCLCSKGTLLDSVCQPEPPFKLILKV